MESLLIWSALIIPSILWGLFCAYKINPKYSIFLAGLIPWLTLLLGLLYSVYYLPYEEVDSSMWPVAQLFAGTIVAVIGVQSYKMGLKLKSKK